jgi:hypothetical protein
LANLLVLVFLVAKDTQLDWREGSVVSDDVIFLQVTDDGVVMSAGAIGSDRRCQLWVAGRLGAGGCAAWKVADSGSGADAF